MNELPASGLVQQLSAKPVTGQHLEVLGKKAAALWVSGECRDLTTAVVETVKTAGLSPEQVKRVVEFANTDAYQQQFRKESAHKYIEFDGGPADVSDVLKDLNDGGGGSVFDDGLGDYEAPPEEVKTSAFKNSFLDKAFQVEELPYPYENPCQELVALREKLASACEHMTSELGGIEIMYMDLGDQLYHHVKQAALNDTPLGHVIQAWQDVSPHPDHVKIAFQRMTPKLMEDGVFYTLDSLGASIEKTAGLRLVNKEHPLVTTFQEFCGTIDKLAYTRAVREELTEALNMATDLLKEAASNPTTIGKAWRFLTEHAGRGGEAVYKSLRKPGEEHVPEWAAKSLRFGISKTPHAAATLGLLEAKRQAEYSPTVQEIAQYIPGTRAERERRAQMAYQRQMLMAQ